MIVTCKSLPYGLFGTTFTWILEVLAYFDRNKVSNLYFDVQFYNAHIDDFFEQRCKKMENDEVVNIQRMKSEHPKMYKLLIPPLKKVPYNFTYAFHLWRKQFKLKDEIASSLLEFEFSATVGVHYRGTDKNTDKNETNPMSIEKFCVVLWDFLGNKKGIKNLFICTDDAHAKELLKSNFSTKYNILTYDSIVSNNGQCLHAFQTKTLALQALKDCLTLAKCKYVLKSSSALSSWAKVFNPNLEIYAVQAFKRPYFPNSCIPLYEPNTQRGIDAMRKSCANHFFHQKICDIK